MSSITNDTQPKVWINGQYLPATQDKVSGDWYVVIDGKKVKVDKNDLFGVNRNLTEHPQYLVDYYDKLLAENEEKRNSLEDIGNYLAKQCKRVAKEYEGFLASIGVKKISEITDVYAKDKAKEYYNNLTALSSDKRRNSNEYFSACMTGFDYALERGEWQNQLALAEHVQNDLNRIV